METPYSKAWDKFKTSSQFKNIIAHMRHDNKIYDDSQDKYYENRIRLAFDAGWNAGHENAVDELSS